MGQLVAPDGRPPRRHDPLVLYCGRCFDPLERTTTGATVCPNGCPP